MTRYRILEALYLKVAPGYLIMNTQYVNICLLFFNMEYFWDNYVGSNYLFETKHIGIKELTSIVAKMKSIFFYSSELISECR